MHKAEYCELLLIVKVKLTADIKRILYNEFTMNLPLTCFKHVNKLECMDMEICM